MRPGRAALAVTLALTALAWAPSAPVAAQAPSGVLSASLAINATYIPVAGNFDCDSDSDEPVGSHNREEPALFMYAPGAATDYLWTDLSISGGKLSVTSVPMALNRSYVPIVGDFDGDRCDDIFWYGPGTAPDALWWGGPTGFTAGRSIAVNGTYRPFTLDENTIFWYAPQGAETLWVPTGSRANPFVSRTAPPVGRSDYQPVAMRNSWNGLPMILWYAPGAASDAAWTLDEGGGGTFQILRSDPIELDGNLRSTRWGYVAVLHGPGAAPDNLVGVDNQNKPALSPITMAGTYVIGGKGRVLLWHAPGSARDEIWLEPSSA